MPRWTPPQSCMAALVAAGLVSALALPADAGPRTRWAEPVLVSSTQAARETSLAVDPTNEKRQLICDPSGVPAVGNGHSYFHASGDGGASWNPVNVEDASTDQRRATFEGGDCDVAYDAGGTMYAADTWVGNLSIGHSTDHGRTWQGVAVSGSSPVIDRPWLVGGRDGTLFVAYQDVQCCMPSAMWFMKSTDHGKTFSRAVQVTGAQAAGLYTWEGNFVVSPDSKQIDLVYSRRDGGVVRLSNTIESIWVAQSKDGGATWTSHFVANLPKETTSIYPSIGRDAGGFLHVVWSAPSANGNPISYTSSADAGRTWRRPVALNPGQVGVAPWVVGGVKGQAAVAWLGSPDADAKQTTSSPWFFSYAKIRLTSKGAAQIEQGRTTSEPLFEGKQTTPEFEMIRYDRRGKLQLGMSVFKAAGKWAVYAQRER